MKKTLTYILITGLALASVLSGCGGSGGISGRGSSGAKKPAGVKEILESEIAAADQGNESDESTEPSDSAETEKGASTSTEFEWSYDPAGWDGTTEASDDPNDPANLIGTPDPDVDLDLTVFSSTVVYSQVTNIMSSPEEYIGKTMKVYGIYSFYYYEPTDTEYYTVMIQDATLCCTQPMEFVLTDDYKYPDDYPHEGEYVTVIGTYSPYEKGEYTGYTLKDATVVIGENPDLSL